MKTLYEILDEGEGRQSIEVVKVADTILPATNNLPIGTVILLMCIHGEGVLGLQNKKRGTKIRRLRMDQPVWVKVEK